MFNPYPHSPGFNDPVKKPFENILGKGENDGNPFFLFFPHFFYPLRENFSFCVSFIWSSENAFNLDSLKVCHLVELKN